MKYNGPYYFNINNPYMYGMNYNMNWFLNKKRFNNNNEIDKVDTFVDEKKKEKKITPSDIEVGEVYFSRRLAKDGKKGKYIVVTNKSNNGGGFKFYYVNSHLSQSAKEKLENTENYVFLNTIMGQFEKQINVSCNKGFGYKSEHVADDIQKKQLEYRYTIDPEKMREIQEKIQAVDPEVSGGGLLLQECYYDYNNYYKNMRKNNVDVAYCRPFPFYTGCSYNSYYNLNYHGNNNKRHK